MRPGCVGILTLEVARTHGRSRGDRTVAGCAGRCRSADVHAFQRASAPRSQHPRDGSLGRSAELGRRRQRGGICSASSGPPQRHRTVSALSRRQRDARLRCGGHRPRRAAGHAPSGQSEMHDRRSAGAAIRHSGGVVRAGDSRTRGQFDQVRCARAARPAGDRMAYRGRPAALRLDGEWRCGGVFGTQSVRVRAPADRARIALPARAATSFRLLPGGATCAISLPLSRPEAAAPVQGRELDAEPSLDQAERSS